MKTPSINGESGRSLLLRAAADLPVRFTFEELCVAAWIEAPVVFGLKGFDEHPDSRKVAVLVHGARGVVADKLLLKVGRKHFKLAKRPRKPKKDLGRLMPSVPMPVIDETEGMAGPAAMLGHAVAGWIADRINEQLPAKVVQRRGVYCKHGQRFDECAACSPEVESR